MRLQPPATLPRLLPGLGRDIPASGPSVSFPGRDAGTSVFTNQLLGEALPLRPATSLILTPDPYVPSFLLALVILLIVHLSC